MSKEHKCEWALRKLVRVLNGGDRYVMSPLYVDCGTLLKEASALTRVLEQELKQHKNCWTEDQKDHRAHPETYGVLPHLKRTRRRSIRPRHTTTKRKRTTPETTGRPQKILKAQPATQHKVS